MNDVAELLKRASRLLYYAAETAEKDQPFNATDHITDALALIAKAKRPLRVAMDKRIAELPVSRLSTLSSQLSTAKEAA